MSMNLAAESLLVFDTVRRGVDSVWIENVYNDYSKLIARRASATDSEEDSENSTEEDDAVMKGPQAQKQKLI